MFIKIIIKISFVVVEPVLRFYLENNLRPVF